MSGIYDGPSEGFATLVDGYVSYAMAVISGRAVPDLRDGLKPVNRRILYSAKEHDKKTLQKCVGLVGDALKLHPHGDGSVYGALALMTDENGTYNIPYFHGMGNLGKVYSSDKPAAMRYPKAMLNENANDFFLDKEVIHLVPAEEGEGYEPSVLPARYPVVLVNGAEGIAVSAGTKMASFNFEDVLNLVIKYIQKGDLDLEDAICPDFPTGGILVKNDAEIAKIMLTGTGKLKIRAKVEIEGKSILVKEVPFGRTVEGIVKKIKNSDIDGISNVINTTGRNSKAFITINCKNKRVVEDVLVTLYRMNILQNVFASNILVTYDGEPKILGVFGLVKEWVKWRKSVLTEKFNYLIDSLQGDKIILDYFLRLVGNEEWKDEYVRRLTKEGKKSCDEYLDSLFEDNEDWSKNGISVKDWIYDRKGSAFNRGGAYVSKYENILRTEQLYKDTLGDLDGYIVNEMQGIIRDKKAAGYCKRKTEITMKDYRFSKLTDESETIDNSYCVFTLCKDGFMYKTRDKINLPKENVLCEVEATADEVLLGFDNFGRIVRIFGKEIPFSGEQGTYMPKYLGTTFEEDYRLLYICKIDGSRKMLVYRDGYIGFLDTSEFEGKRNSRVINNGVCLAVRDKLLEVYDEDKVPRYLLLADDSYMDRVRIGIVETEGIAIRSRTSRAKVLNGDYINTSYIKGFNDPMQLSMFMEHAEQHIGKLKWYKGNFYGEDTEIADGTYLDICKDLEITDAE